MHLLPMLWRYLFTRKCEYSNKGLGSGNCILHTVIKLRKSCRGGSSSCKWRWFDAIPSLWAQSAGLFVYFDSLKETCELAAWGFEWRGGLIAYLQFLLEKIMTTPRVITERTASTLKWCLGFAIIFAWC